VSILGGEHLQVNGLGAASAPRTLRLFRTAIILPRLCYSLFVALSG